MASLPPQPGREGVAGEQLAAKVAASFEAPKSPQVTQPEAVTAQPDHKVEAARTDHQLTAVKDTIDDLPGQVAQLVSAPARQVSEQITGISRPDNAEQSIRELLDMAKGPADLQKGANQLRLAHIEAHHDLDEEAAQ